jgi:Spy/CpxP family protein refolding chaperone
MKRNRIAKSFAIAAQCMSLMAAPGMPRIQSSAPQAVQPSAPLGAQRDPYAEAFAGLTYSDEQKEAIRKIREDIESRKGTVVKDDKLSPDQKDALLSGFTRMEYTRIYEELTPEQKKLVSTRMHARRASGQDAQKTQRPPR